MNRINSLARSFLLAGGLLGAAAAAAQEGNQQQNFSSATQPAYEALSAGRQAKEEGDLDTAQQEFRKALELSRRGSDPHRAAREELTFHLPFLRAEGFVRTEQWQKAERLLENLLQTHQNDVKKAEELAQLITLLRESARSRSDARRPGREVIRYVERRLEGFLRDKGRYPRGYEELNAVLVPGEPPMDDYEIVHYVGAGGAFGLTLRGKANPDNVLTVQRTGVVE